MQLLTTGQSGLMKRTGLVFFHSPVLIWVSGVACCGWIVIKIPLGFHHSAWQLLSDSWTNTRSLQDLQHTGSPDTTSQVGTTCSGEQLTVLKKEELNIWACCSRPVLLVNLYPLAVSQKHFHIYGQTPDIPLASEFKEQLLSVNAGVYVRTPAWRIFHF